VLAGPLFYRREQAREVLAIYRDFIAGAPDELAVYLNLRSAPPLDWVPSGLRGEDVLRVIPCWSGDLEEGERFVRPLRRFGPPAADQRRLAGGRAVASGHQWCRSCFTALEPHATGCVYVNFMHNDEGEARVWAAYGARYERLARIKARYDPDNVFRSNQNIRPAR
jgi:FAD/FMN-containing dehydrogenase